MCKSRNLEDINLCSLESDVCLTKRLRHHKSTSADREKFHVDMHLLSIYFCSMFLTLVIQPQMWLYRLQNLPTTTASVTSQKMLSSHRQCFLVPVTPSVSVRGGQQFLAPVTPSVSVLGGQQNMTTINKSFNARRVNTADVLSQHGKIKLQYSAEE